MTIRCNHVHKLELQSFFIFCVAHSPVRLDILTKFLILIIDNHVKNKKYGNFVSISSLKSKCAAQKFQKNFCSSSLWTFLYHMVILRSQNKITDFLWFETWACPLKALISVIFLFVNISMTFFQLNLHTDPVIGQNVPLAIFQR